MDSSRRDFLKALGAAAVAAGIGVSGAFVPDAVSKTSAYNNVCRRIEFKRLSSGLRDVVFNAVLYEKPSLDLKRHVYDVVHDYFIEAGYRDTSFTFEMDFDDPEYVYKLRIRFNPYGGLDEIKNGNYFEFNAATLQK